MEQKMADINAPLGLAQKTQQQSTYLDFIIKLLTDGFLREMDLQIHNNQKNIQFPKIIYEQCFKFFPRYEHHSLIKNPLLNLNLYVAGCYLTDAMNPLQINIITECTQKIRKILSIESNPPIDDIIDSGITPKLIEFLNINYNKYSNLQFEACWSLTNICSGTRKHVHTVINNEHNPNAIPYLIQLLASENISIKEQSIWALGNVCGDSPECRNLVLSNNILLQLIPLIQSICNEITANNSPISQEKLTLLRNATWAVSNLCRGKPGPNVQYIISIIPILNTLLTTTDDEVLMDTLWSYSYLTETPSIIPNWAKHLFPNNKQNIKVKGEGEGPPNMQMQIQIENNIINGDGPEKKDNNDNDNDNEQTILDLIFISDGVISCIINLLESNKVNIIHPALRILGNICTSNDNDTQRVLDYGILDKLYNLLTGKNNNNFLAHRKHAIKRETLWTISNIMAGNNEQIQCVLNNKLNLLPILNAIMINDKYELSKEAVWCISNALSCCTDRQIDYLIIHESIIQNLCLFINRFKIRFVLQITKQIEQERKDNIINFNPPFASFTVLRVALEGIEKILQIENGKYALFAEQYGLLNEIESLLKTNNIILKVCESDNKINQNIQNTQEKIKALNDKAVIKLNDIIDTYYSDAPSQIIQLLMCDILSDRKKCCVMLRKQLLSGSIFHCTRIIQCDHLILYLLYNLKNNKNDIFIRNDIVYIIHDLFKKLDNSLKFLKDINDVNNIKKVIYFIIDQNVILPSIDFLLFLINEKNQKEYKNNINIGKTIYLIMEMIEMVLKYKNEEIIKFYIIKCDGVYAMKQMINNYELNLKHKEIINISSNIMKQYFKFQNGKNKYPNFEKTLVYGYFRMNLNVDLNEIQKIMEICCHYGYDYTFEQNKRRSSIIIESNSLIKNSTSDLVQFDIDNEIEIDNNEVINYDDILLDLNFD